MSEANQRVDSAEPNPVGMHKHPRSRSPQSFLLSLLGDLEVRSFGGGADFLAQQKMLPCATNDAALRNKRVGGCARRLMGYGKLQGKKCK